MKYQLTNDLFSVRRTLNIAGSLLNLDTPKVMGILNVTPDSFFDGGRFVTEVEILRQTEKMLSEGATFIDVGAYSSRPGANDITAGEEIRRSTEAIKCIIREFPAAIISIDTFRVKVAEEAILEGATMINDISSGDFDASMPALAVKHSVPYIAMHMKGTPATMKSLAVYDDLIKEIIDYFHQKLSGFRAMGLKDVIIDPGFGFAKTIEQNFALLNNLDYFGILGRPVLVGISRKSMVWKTLEQNPEDALNGTTSLNTIALLKGARILRVHDVKEAMGVIKLVTATTSASE
ncbi:MAG: dihydropteroate synthase [Chryseolinea sp.]